MLISSILLPIVFLFVPLHESPFTWILMALIFILAAIEVAFPRAFPRLFLPRGSIWASQNAGSDQQGKLLSRARRGAFIAMLLDIVLAVGFLSGWFH